MSDYILLTHPKNLTTSVPVSPDKRPSAMYFPKQQLYPTRLRERKLHAEAKPRRHHHLPKDFHFSKIERGLSYPKQSHYWKSSKHMIIQPPLRRDKRQQL
jgi:hypothetical protein